PLAEEADDRARLRRLELRPVAVEVEPLRVLAHAGSLLGPVLAGPVVGGHALVSVGIEERNDGDVERAEELGTLALGKLAREDEERLLSAGLAGMDAAEEEDGRLP